MWGGFTDDVLDVIAGKREELVASAKYSCAAALQYTLFYSKDGVGEGDEVEIGQEIYVTHRG